MDRAANLRAIKAGKYTAGRKSDAKKIPARGAIKTPGRVSPQRKSPIKRGSPQKKTPAGISRKDLDKFYKERDAEFTGTCGCGCGQPSFKGHKKLYRSSVAHIWPKEKFPSIALHPLNAIERAIDCHVNFDVQGVDRWPKMKDWPEIRRRIMILGPLIDPAERKGKFYNAIKKLVLEHP